MKQRRTTTSLKSRHTDRSARQLVISVFILAAAVSGGTLGYMLIEGWSIGDSLYMTVISLTTTGFQEVQNLSPAGRVLTGIVIVSGIASLAYVGGRVLQLAVEVYLIRRGRMNRSIHRLKNHVILCGYGRMGRHIANDLTDANVPFVVLESNAEMMPELEESGVLYLIGSASEDDLLREAGVERARGLIAVVSSDAENVFTTLTAKSLNPNISVVARALADETESKLRTAGADRVIKPYELVGRRIAQLIIRPSMIEFVDTIVRSKSGEITVEEIPIMPTSALVGSAMRDTPIRSSLNVIIVAIRRAGAELLYNPSADTVFQPDDRIVAIGKPEQLVELGSLCGVDAIK